MVSPGKNNIIVDTGPLVALLAAKDQYHLDAVRLFGRVRQPMITCWPVLTEAAWLLRQYPNGRSALLGLVERKIVLVSNPAAADAVWLAMFMDRYQSIGCQLADACIVMLAERLNASVFTFDRRDFAVYRLDSGAPVTLIEQE